MAKLVSKTYGDALFETAVEEDRVDDFAQEAKGILEILRQNQDLSRLMDHPQIVKEEKLQVIEAIFQGKVSDEIIGLMRLLVAKNHFSEMEAVFSYFIEEVKEYKNIGTAYVVSPVALTEEQKKQVEARLLETTKYVSFEMHYDVDASLIGGMVIRIGDRVVDSSIKTKLYGLSRELYRVPLGMAESGTSA